MEVPLIVQITVTGMMLMLSGPGICWYAVDRLFATKQHVPMSSRHTIHLFLGACSLILLSLLVIHVHLSFIGVVSLLLFMGISFICSALWDNWWLFRLLRDRKLHQHPPRLQHIELPYPLFELQMGIVYAAGGGALGLKYVFGVNDESMLAGFFLFFIVVASIGFGSVIKRWKRSTMNALRREKDKSENIDVGR